MNRLDRWLGKARRPGGPFERYVIFPLLALMLAALVFHFGQVTCLRDVAACERDVRGLTDGR